MLATFVIGLREGLEAALIVGIIAAFLKRNNSSLKPMWWGVATAIALSVAVGFVLTAIEASLPQAQQELMEAIIGAVAVVFVTGMIVWMKKHSRGMKRELEAEAQAALGNGTTWAMAGMAFLAVLKEGFETSVFLLATFQASTSEGAAVIGAVLGLLAAIGIGIGIYTGGVRLNLSKFFTATGVFLVFVAAGLVISTLRSAHGAGLFSIGQGRTVDLTWLAPNGSIQAALITGVLGIPADPRVIEVLGWSLYLIPVLAYSVWPKAWLPRTERVPRIQLIGGGMLALAALALAVSVPTAGSGSLPTGTAPITGQNARVADGTVTLSVDGSTARLSVAGVDTASYQFSARDASASSHAGADTQWRLTGTQHLADQPTTLSLDQLVVLAGGRVPVGVDAARNPGPFDAQWTQTSTVSAWSYRHTLVDAQRTVRTVLSVSGGGLTAPRALAVASGDGTWQVASSYVSAASSAISSAARTAAEAMLWKLWLPLVLMFAAATLTWRGLSGLRAQRTAAQIRDPMQVRADTHTRNDTHIHDDPHTRNDPPTPGPAATTSPTTPRSTSYASKS